MKAPLLPLIALHLLLAGPESPQEAVERGREALARSGNYPWYDRTKDQIRRVELEKERQPRKAAESIIPANVIWWMAWIAIAIVLVVVVILLARAYVRRPFGAAAKRVSGSSETAAEVERLADLPVAKRGDFLDRARQLYQAGDFDEAIKYLYSHQLVQLDRHQLVRLARGKTNRQYLAELRPRPALQQVLQQTMVAFEDVFFGDHRLGRERFESCWSQLDRFQALLTEGALG